MAQSKGTEQKIKQVAGENLGQCQFQARQNMEKKAERLSKIWGDPYKGDAAGRSFCAQHHQLSCSICSDMETKLRIEMTAWYEGALKKCKENYIKDSLKDQRAIKKRKDAAQTQIDINNNKRNQTGKTKTGKGKFGFATFIDYNWGVATGGTGEGEGKEGGIYISEVVDLSEVLPLASTNEKAKAGRFVWGNTFTVWPYLQQESSRDYSNGLAIWFQGKLDKELHVNYEGTLRHIQPVMFTDQVNTFSDINYYINHKSDFKIIETYKDAEAYRKKVISFYENIIKTQTGSYFKEVILVK